MKYYVAIDKNIEIFNKHKALWETRDIHGIRTETMSKGIEKAMEIENSKPDDLLFVVINSEGIEYIPQLEILGDEISVPIIVGSPKYSNNEQRIAIKHGADHYGQISKIADENIESLLIAMSRPTGRSKIKRSLPTMICGDILISPSRSQRTVFVKDKKIELTKMEFDALRYLMANNGNILSHTKLMRKIWGDEYDDKSRNLLWDTIKRLREKLRVSEECPKYIETERDVGYRFRA